VAVNLDLEYLEEAVAEAAAAAEWKAARSATIKSMPERA
jgi:hypothetical protein